MRKQVRKSKRPDIQTIEISERKEKCWRGNYQNISKKCFQK